MEGTMSMEPVAWVRESDLKEMQESNIGIEMDVFSFWSDMFDVDVALVRLSDAEARIRELEAKLAEADAMIDAQQHDFAKNNIRNAENAHRAEATESQMSEIAGHLDSECDSDSILHVIREIEADRDIYKNRATAAEALLKEAGKALEPFVAIIEEYDPWKEGDDVQGTLVIGSLTDYSLMLGHLRAARAIHDKIGVKDE